MPEITVGDVTLAYDISGPEEGDPIVVISGIGMPADVWQFFGVPQLVAAGWRVITFDNRGMPPSSAPPAPYTVADLTDDTIGLLEHLRLGPCPIIGYSLGGWIAEVLAVKRPDLVSAVVLGASANDTCAWEKIRYRLGFELARDDVPLPPTYDLVETLSYLPTAKLQDNETVEGWAALLEGNTEFPNPGRLGQWAAAMTQSDRSVADRDADRAAIACPCLVLAFEHDWDSPPALAREAAAKIPNAAFVELAGLGHLAVMEDPDVVMRTITDFLATI